MFVYRCEINELFSRWLMYCGVFVSVVGHISMKKALIKVNKCPPRELLASFLPSLSMNGDDDDDGGDDRGLRARHVAYHNHDS